MPILGYRQGDYQLLVISDETIRYRFSTSVWADGTSGNHHSGRARVVTGNDRRGNYADGVSGRAAANGFSRQAASLLVRERHPNLARSRGHAAQS